MMKEPRVLFVKQFLANLFVEDVKTIPINNESFKGGIGKMAEYFFENKEIFGPYAEKLELLFLQYTIRGDYSEFADIIESFNGRVLSLENPYYVRANIKFRDDYDKQLIADEQLEIESAVYQKLVKYFCEGAGIQVSA
ncbi:MAG: hypothetical protein IJ274_16270 [Lachnospiraceae bacterium]|nr:hypothetical protein [Lachnospiraceae bacterium]